MVQMPNEITILAIVLLYGTSTAHAQADCAQRAECEGLTKDEVCQFPKVVTDCKILCEVCDVKVSDCKDKPICKVIKKDVEKACELSAVADDCPELCSSKNKKASCHVKEDKTVRTSFTLDKEDYEDELADPKTDEFKQLKTKVEETEVKSALNKKEPLITTVVVNGFTRSGSGKVVVDADITITEKDLDLNAAHAKIQEAFKGTATALEISDYEVGVCSSGFVAVNLQCLMFSTEYLVWKSAGEKCKALNSRLVVPTDLKEIAAHIIKEKLMPVQFWVGASDKEEEGTYRWVDHTKVESSLWYPRYPINAGVPPGESCVRLYTSTIKDYGLLAASDSKCNGKNTYGYICEEHKE